MAEPVLPIDPNEMPFTVPPDAGGEEMAPMVAPRPLTREEALLAALPEHELLQLCLEYKNEAVSARETGDNARDEAWSNNLDMYWRRIDFSDKEEWQHREASVIGKKAVDRFGASMRRALIRPGFDWYAIDDPTRTESDIYPSLRRITDAALSRCGTTASGHEAAYPLTFGRIMKIGALMLAAQSVYYDRATGRTRTDPVDPREVYLDPKGAGLYRIRSREMDWYKAMQMPNLIPERLVGIGEWTTGKREQEHNQATGHTEGGSPSGRKRMLVDEFYFHCLLDRDGNKIAEDVIVVVFNEQRVVRGPEENPNWHGTDHLIVHPLIDSPLSVYGGTYAEDFFPIWRTISRFENLILDGVTLETLANYMAHPEWILDAAALNEGVRPFKMWFASPFAPPNQAFLEKIDLGSLPRSTMDVYAALLSNFREATSQNEIRLGQLPGKGERTATEIAETSQSSDELVQDIAEGIDAGFLSPTLRAVFYTELQHMDPLNPETRRRVGDAICDMVAVRREELRERSFGFRASAISAMAARQQRGRNVVQLIQAIGANQVLAQALLRTHSLQKILDDLWRSWGLDAAEYQLAPNEQPPLPPEATAPPALPGTAARGEEGGDDGRPEA